jgi:hypothetical protein
MPKRSNVCRMDSPVTRWSVRPWANLTSAARSSVHRLVAYPKSRGLRCKSAQLLGAVVGEGPQRWLVRA